MPSPFFTTGPRGLLRALLGTSNVSDIDAGFLALATDVENKMVNYSSGLASAMPAAGVDGRFYRQTDTKLIFFDDGTTWRPVMIPGAWVNLTLGAGITAAGPYTPSVRLEGDLVRLKGGVAPTSTIAPFTTLATIASASMRPGGNIGVTGGGNAWSLEVLSTGVINAGVTITAGVPVFFDGITFTLT